MKMSGRPALGSAVVAMILLGMMPAGSSDAPEQQMGMVVRNIVVWAAVNGRRGRPKKGLRRSDFTLRDEGVVQEISDFSVGASTPLSVQILVDASESMQLSGLLLFAKKAAWYLLGQTDSRDVASLWYFAGGKNYRDCPLGTSKTKVMESLNLLSGFGRTVLRDSIFDSLTLEKAAPGTRKAVFLFTDGKDNASRISEQDLLALAGSINVPIHAIILSPRLERDTDPATFQRLGDVVAISGGRMTIVYPLDWKATVEAIDDSMNRLRQSYVLEYSPTGPSRRGFHRIQVEAPCRRCSVLHRKGYYAR